jgi:hypothetical protein
MTEQKRLDELVTRVATLEGKLNATHYLLSVLVAELAAQGYSSESIGKLAVTVADNYDGAEGFREQGEALDDLVASMLETMRNELANRGAKS